MEVESDEEGDWRACIDVRRQQEMYDESKTEMAVLVASCCWQVCKMWKAEMRGGDGGDGYDQGDGGDSGDGVGDGDDGDVEMKDSVGMCWITGLDGGEP